MPAIAAQRDGKGETQSPAPIARALIKDTGTINAYLSNPVVRNNFPQDLKFLWGKKNADDDGKPIPVLDLYAIRTIPGSDKARIEGESIENASQDFDPNTTEVIEKMSMNKQGAKAWADMTTKNPPKPIAIVLDNIVYSAPFV